jgi:hypothetical protein
MPQLKPNPALDQLQVLVGDWTMESPQYPEGRGLEAFRWLEGGAFLVQQSEAERDAFPSSTWIIGRDDSTETYCVLYYDSRGVSRVYQMSLSGGVWKLWRDAPGFSQRFTGTIADDGSTIRGQWESSQDGSNWEHDFDLTYTKTG